MNALAVVAMMGGSGVDPELIRVLQAQENERKEKLEKLIVNLGKNAVTGYRYFKGEPKLIDAHTGKEIPPEDTRFAGLMAKYRQEQDIKFDMFENLVNSTVELALAFSKSSSLEIELMARLMNRKQDSRPSADSARFSG